MKCIKFNQSLKNLYESPAGLMPLNSRFLLPTVIFILILGSASAFGQTIGGSVPAPPSGPEPPNQAVLGKPVYLPKPDFPRNARERRLFGPVDVHVEIDATGRVTSARFLNGDPAFAEVCEAAARQARFTPTTIQGVAVPTTGTVTFSFNVAKNYENHLWFDVGRMLATVSLGNSARLEHRVSKTVVSNRIGSGERNALFKVLEPGEAGPNAERAQKSIQKIQKKLRTEHPLPWWFFELGMIRSRLEDSAQEDADLEAFKSELVKMRAVCLLVPEQVPESLVSRLRSLAGFSLKENLTKAEREGIVRSLIENSETLFLVTPDPKN